MFEIGKKYECVSVVSGFDLRLVVDGKDPPKDEPRKFPYLSQWDPTAEARPGDCGPAVLAMLIHGLTDYRPTVDDVAAACGQPTKGKGRWYTNHAQLRRGAAVYGVTLRTRSKYRLPIYDWDLIVAELENDWPSIALLHYGVLHDLLKKYPKFVQNQDIGYRRGHWVAVVNFFGDWVQVQDPDFWGDRRLDGNYRRIPRAVFKAALRAIAPGCTVGNQGLVMCEGIK